MSDSPCSFCGFPVLSCNQAIHGMLDRLAALEAKSADQDSLLKNKAAAMRDMRAALSCQPAPVTEFSSDFSLLDDEDATRNPAFASFTGEMKGRAYGAEALNDAWEWFKSGFDQREAREAELEAALKTARAERDTRSELILQFDDRLREVRAELAAERAKSAAPGCTNPIHVKTPHDRFNGCTFGTPAPGGTNRERAGRLCMDYSNDADHGYEGRHVEAIAAALDEAESRGRNAAHGDAVKAWRALDSVPRGWAMDCLFVDIQDTPLSRACDLARAALAELAGTEVGKVEPEPVDMMAAVKDALAPKKDDK